MNLNAAAPPSSASAPSPAAAWQRPSTLALMAASGFAGLGYQIVWTQQCALWLGHESAAVFAVLAAFFGGLALGAFAAGPRIERSRRPLRWYAACEALIALWGLLLVLLMSPASGWLLTLGGVQPAPARQWTVAFIGTFVLLLPATAAMGATLPAMERAAARLHAGSRSIAAHYASNTFGAVLGVLGTAFWLVPQLGLSRTAAVCVALNAGCAVAAWRVLPELPAGDLAVPAPAALALPRASSQARGKALALLALTGLLGIGYEVLAVRALSQVTENTVYTFALLLAVYLVGSALGAAAYRRWLLHRPATDALDSRLLAALAAACLLGTVALWASEPIRSRLLADAGGDLATAIGVEALLALLAFGPPTLVMGALFCHLCDHAHAAGISYGRSLGVNTLGAAMAPLLFGVIAVPALGLKLSLVLVAAAYLALVPVSAWRRPWVWVPAAAAAALVIWAPSLAFVSVPEGGRILSYREGAMATVSVVEDAAGVARLHINNRQQEGSSATRRVDARQALLPLLLHPAPQRALFLGLGTGITASAAAQDPTLEVDVVELLPEVIESSSHFTGAFGDGRPNPRLHLLAADARRYVRVAETRYDVIVSDNFHPARSGSGSLYTVEHFEAVRGRLAAGGVFCQWLPLHQLDLATLRSIVQSFVKVYPGGWAMLASNSLTTPVLGLVGRADKGLLRIEQLRARLANAADPLDPAGVGIEDPFALLGSFVAGPEALARFAGDAAANTDDQPVVAYRAPYITYVPDSLPQARLLALLDELRVKPADLLGEDADAAFGRRLAAYWTARDRFIEIGRIIRPSSDVRLMLAQVYQPLLTLLRISADFRPAYDPLLRMALALAPEDERAARTMLTELALVQPARTEAGIALRRLGDR